MRFTDILMNSAHAYIISGGNFDRKDFVSKLVKALNCTAENFENRPCMQCQSCRQIEAGTSMDIVHMQKSGKITYTVKDAVAMIERLEMGSFGRHVIGVIDEADALSETVQNKLLKTLEEPAVGVVIILSCANPSALLPTVRSRCNEIRINEYVEALSEDIDSEIAGITDELFNESLFFKQRNIIDKKIKSQEEAFTLLGLYEDSCRDLMVDTTDKNIVQKIELIEKTRRDIQMGMNYSKALRRLCLELA